MKKIIKKIILTFVLISINNIAAFCQDTENRLKAKLNDLGINYTITKMGNFKLELKTQFGKRNQVVYITPQTVRFKNQEILKIYTCAVSVKSKTEIEQEILFYLLIYNSTSKMGAWEISGEDNDFSLIFSESIDITESNDYLKALIDEIAFNGDDMELNLTGKDVK